MKNLFIDTNIWLSLYHFTSDDLEQFNKLKDLIGKDIVLFVPQQVYDEIFRNREAKLKDAFKSFELKKIKYPAFCKEYAEYDQFSRDYNDLIKRFNDWREKINNDILTKSLPADNTVRAFFETTGTIPCEDYVDKAFMRYRIGNPPGKNNKYGDAVNWECLLSIVPDGEDLYFISADQDYRSEYSDDVFNPFLNAEWENKKKSKIVFYRNLVPFLKEHIKSVQLKTEQEKQELIKKLADSSNFVTTHGIITLLSRFSGWTESQVEELCSIAEDNTQVGWIISDNDVASFYKGLMTMIDYEKLKDSATKRIIDLLSYGENEGRESARYDYEVEKMDALEENSKH